MTMFDERKKGENVKKLRADAMKSLDDETKRRLKRLRRYIMPHHDDYMFGAAFTALGVALLVALAVTGQIDKALLSLVLILLGAFFVYFAVKDTFAYRNRISDIVLSNGAAVLLNDFENGERAFKDSVILGDKYLLGKRGGEIIDYSEIMRIYQYVEKDALFESKRDLCLELNDERKVHIGNIPLKGKGDEELARVMKHICSKNQNTAVGYAG